MSSQSLPAPTSPTVGRKRRIDSETQPQTPARRRKVSTTRVNQVLKRQGVGNSLTKAQDGNRQRKSPGPILLSSPTDVADASVVQVQQIRTKQAKASGLPNLSPPPAIVTKVDQQQEEVSDVEAEEEAMALTPRPTATVRRRPPQRPPLSLRQAVAVNRARFGVGIVRCRSWQLGGEETETEDESPPPSPRDNTSNFPVSPSSCKCPDEENLEEIVGASVLPIDPSQTCFDPSYGEDRWQIRSPSPDEEFVPEFSCCAGKNGEKGVKGDYDHEHANANGGGVETESVHTETR
ncbi:hypothetical protein PR003_g5284 [Phytophthora rubi]|uniref:Uncharacterized protein n=1 Tax=Phytophthora rubi TaxID=129364 RepID=A0A6A4G4W4_9STRA|nr:hypothetical protein PR001_g18219 [Phytophthora rubi]KAE9039518.1 hypothetical protein PR002_g5455 [Phytophthora rubi]KAE9350640.1 hypothetical protein PR003_g5284 [Phytophthora rubi]